MDPHTVLMSMYSATVRVKFRHFSAEADRRFRNLMKKFMNTIELVNAFLTDQWKSKHLKNFLKGHLRPAKCLQWLNEGNEPIENLQGFFKNLLIY